MSFFSDCRIFCLRLKKPKHDEVQKPQQKSGLNYLECEEEVKVPFSFSTARHGIEFFFSLCTGEMHLRMRYQGFNLTRKELTEEMLPINELKKKTLPSIMLFQKIQHKKRISFNLMQSLILITIVVLL